MALGDFQTAMEMREILQQLVKDEMERQRPRYQYATVTAYDRTTRKCSVQFPGEVGSVSVNMGSIQPSYVGQTVRVGGLAGDRFIEDVMGIPWFGSLDGSVDQNIVVGETDDTAARSFVARKKATTGSNYYESLMYLAQPGVPNDTTSRAAWVYKQNGAEVSRVEAYPDGSHTVTGAGAFNLGSKALNCGVITTPSNIDAPNVKYYGQVNDSALITPAAGWTLTDANARRWGPTIVINFAFQRSGAAVASNTTGNIINVTLGTVTNATYQPYAETAIIPTRSTGVLWGGYINSAGTIAVSALLPGTAGNIATGDYLYGSCVSFV